MTVNEHWIYQGRQSHGWFGTGTAPKDENSDTPTGANPLFKPVNAGQRVDYAASSIIHVPRNERGRWNSAVSDSARDRLKTAVAAWYGASALSRDAFRAQFLDPYTSNETVDSLRSAAQGMIEGRTYDDLAKAGKDLAAAAQQIGVDRWPRFLGDATRKADAAVQGDVPGVSNVDYAGDMVAGGIALGGLVVLLGGLLGNRQSSRHQGPAPQLAPPTVMQAAPVPPPKEGETPADVLKPEGRLVGQAGSSADIRELPGGEQAAEEMFDRLTKSGSDITPPRYPGKRVRLPNGDTIGYRSKSTSGPPTIDVDVAGVGIEKLKFRE